MNRRSYLAALGAGATGALAGCSALAGSSGLSESAFDVAMYANRFEPKAFTVTVGESVTWGNTGSRGHSVTAYEGSIPDDAAYFASGGFETESAAVNGWPRAGDVMPGETYTHTFETAGEFPYYCIPHEPAGMVGTVVVEDD